jgi:hypothetical protein
MDNVTNRDYIRSNRSSIDATSTRSFELVRSTCQLIHDIGNLQSF